jgi:2-polyprenyl-6-hydroxyphenyl methylase/3-demethylubiquinone-9 3-methyltransferase
VIPPTFDPDWPADVMALYRHDMQEMWDRSIAPQVWNQYHNQLDIYFGLCEGAGALDILDVGCAQATLALLLAEKGHRVCAMDIRRRFLDYAATRHERGEIRFVCGNALEDDPGQSFDLIFANQIIEHLVYPADLLGRLRSWLRPGGRLVVTTPNGEYFRNSLPRFAEIGDPARYDGMQHSADADGHFFAYWGDELAGLFVAAGLHDPEVRYFETPWISGHAKARYLHPWLPVALLRALDRITLRVPILGRRAAHQLMVLGKAP